MTNSLLSEYEFARLAEYRDLTDRDLLVKYQEGDIEAIGALYARHARLIFRFGLAKGLDFQDAEDLVEDTFSRIIDGIQTFKGDHPSSGRWLNAVKYRALYDFFRRRGRVLKREGPMPEEDLVASLFDAEEDALEREIHEAYNCARHKLSEQELKELDQGPGRGTGRKTWPVALSRLIAEFENCYGGQSVGEEQKR